GRRGARRARRLSDRVRSLCVPWQERVASIVLPRMNLGVAFLSEKQSTEGVEPRHDEHLHRIDQGGTTIALPRLEHDLVLAARPSVEWLFHLLCVLLSGSLFHRKGSPAGRILSHCRRGDVTDDRAVEDTHPPRPYWEGGTAHAMAPLFERRAVLRAKRTHGGRRAHPRLAFLPTDREPRIP